MNIRTFVLIFLVPIMVSVVYIPSARSDWDTPAVGKLLVADQSLQDPRFVQTIVLLFRYGKDGAAGLILNHPTQAEISKLFPEVPGIKNRKELVHLGGPVSLNSIFVLVQSREPGENAERVFENIFISTDRSLMQSLLGKIENEALLRFYAGYAGWGAGQLDREIAGGHWHVLPADTRAIFNSNPAEIWREFLERSNVIQARVDFSESVNAAK